MNIVAVCVTYNRPKLLGRAIHCFLQQNTQARLLILDDANQYSSEEHENWCLESVEKRYPDLSAKRNAAVQKAVERWPDTEAIMTWDDDDVYFPHAVEEVSKALEKKCWAQPRVVLETLDGNLTQVQTHKKGPKDICYGGSWAWKLDAFNKCGGFPSGRTIGEDQELGSICFEKFGASASSADDNPWYWYNQEGTHMAAIGKQCYHLRGKEIINTVKELSISWNGDDFYCLPVLPVIQPRPF